MIESRRGEILPLLSLVRQGMTTGKVEWPLAIGHWTLVGVWQNEALVIHRNDVYH
jgi:hypothetical protein